MLGSGITATDDLAWWCDRAVEAAARRLWRCPTLAPTRQPRSQPCPRPSRACPASSPAAIRSPRSSRPTASSSSPARSATCPGSHGAVPGGIEPETPGDARQRRPAARAVGLGFADVVKCHGLPARLRRLRGVQHGLSRVLPDGAPDQGDGGRDRPGRGLQRRDRGPRRCASSPTANSSIATYGWPAVPATSMTRVCAPAVDQVLVNTALRAVNDLAFWLTVATTVPSMVTRGLAAGRTDRAVPDDPGPGEPEGRGRACTSWRTSTAFAGVARVGRATSRRRCRRSAALFSE